MLQNATGNRSLFYYLTLIRTAKLCGCRVSLLAAGIGPVHGEKQRKQVRDVLNRCDRIEVRDPDSMRFLLCIGVKRELLTVVQDPAVFLPLPPPTRRIFLLTECGIPIGTPYFCAALRTPEDAGTLTRLAAAFRLVAEKHALVPVFFVMDRERDRSATAAVCRAIGGKTVRIREPADVPAILSGCRFLVSMRLHALFFADRCGVPAVALSAGEEEPKLASFCRETGVPLFPACVSVPALTAELERTGVL